MAGPLPFPARAFIQKFVTEIKGQSVDRLPPENAMVLAELTARHVPCVVLTTEQFLAHPSLTEHDLVVGDFDWTRAALQRLRRPFPVACDYPPCLRHLLHRRIWESTLGDVAAQLAGGAAAMFIKPAVDTKAFSGLVASVDWLAYLREQFPASFPVLCSELVHIVSEYRVYVVHGAVRSVCNYKGRADGEGAIDMAVVNGAVNALMAVAPAPAACAIDFAVIRQGGGVVTSLMEVNEAFSLGAYEGLSGRDYTDLLVARWQQLVART